MQESIDQLEKDREAATDDMVSTERANPRCFSCCLCRCRRCRSCRGFHRFYLSVSRSCFCYRLTIACMTGYSIPPWDEFQSGLPAKPRGHIQRNCGLRKILQKFSIDVSLAVLHSTGCRGNGENRRRNSTEGVCCMYAVIKYTVTNHFVVLANC